MPRSPACYKRRGAIYDETAYCYSMSSMYLPWWPKALKSAYGVPSRMAKRRCGYSSNRLEKQRNLCNGEFHLQRRSGNRILEEATESHKVGYLFTEEKDRFLKDAEFRLLRLRAFPAFDDNPDHTTMERHSGGLRGVTKLAAWCVSQYYSTDSVPLHQVTTRRTSSISLGQSDKSKFGLPILSRQLSIIASGCV